MSGNLAKIAPLFILLVLGGLILGTQLGSGGMMLPMIVGGGAMLLLAGALAGKKMPVDAVVLLVAIAGYVILGKGFAYQRVGSFLFMGELTLGLATVAYLIRWIGGGQSIVPRSPMAYALLALGLYSFLHLMLDFQRYGIMALRDSCVIYYTVFFFIAYQLGSSTQTNASMRRFLLWLAPVGLVVEMTHLVPAIQESLRVVSVMGVPLFIPHIDSTVHLVFGLVLFLYFRWEQRRPWALVALLGLLVVMGYVAIQARGAAYMSMIAVAAIFLLAGRLKFFAVTVPAAALGLILVLGVISSGIGSKYERVRAMEEQLEALNPFVAHKQQTMDQSTAEWRLYWWKKIARDVTKNEPFFGFGFGADISSGFVKEFFRLATTSEQHERTRGAHNVFFTILARLGWVGALFFVVVVAAQCWYFVRMIRAVRRGWLTDDELFMWGLVLAGFVVGFFQYAWEAPYSAIPYWTYCGLAYSRLDAVEREHAHVGLSASEAAVVRPQPGGSSQARPQRPQLALDA